MVQGLAEVKNMDKYALKSKTFRLVANAVL